MEKRLQEAQLYKEKGNQCYWEGKYRDAVSGYHRALLQLQGLDPSLPSPIPNLGPQGPALTLEQENLLHTTQTDCYNNLAACLLQMEPVNYERVKEYSQKVLEWPFSTCRAMTRPGTTSWLLSIGSQKTPTSGGTFSGHSWNSAATIGKRSSSTWACLVKRRKILLHLNLDEPLETHQRET
uniref:Tetratricopeptide repeat domain 9C n=1 Tax=Bos mutus grunniens TaxID=30521 RepID=A0A8B9Y945_BOSMU